jgi:hypothetical protein
MKRRDLLHWRTWSLVVLGYATIVALARWTPGAIIPASTAIVALCSLGAGKSIAEHLSGAQALRTSLEGDPHA